MRSETVMAIYSLIFSISLDLFDLLDQIELPLS